MLDFECLNLDIGSWLINFVMGQKEIKISRGSRGMLIFPNHISITGKEGMLRFM